jgi:hypothetical protein
MQARRQCSSIFKVMKEKCMPRILYLANIAFSSEIIAFPDTQVSLKQAERHSKKSY